MSAAKNPNGVPPRGSRSRTERLLRAVTAGGLAAGALLLALWAMPAHRPADDPIELVASRPVSGGFSRERIVVNQGERVHLRIRAEDVVHGFAIGRLGVDAGPIEPGKPVTVEFVADRPGEYTFYCTEWCDPNHSRMRGVLEVRDTGGPARAPASSHVPAPDATLQHLDDPRDAGVVPPGVPSAVRGLSLYGQRCAGCHGERGEGTARAAAIGRRAFLFDRSPVELFRMLAAMNRRDGPARVGAHGQTVATASQAASSHAPYAREWSEQERWDVVAALWSFGTTPDRIDLGRRLYLKNCAACHGERGAGDGPGGKQQPKAPADLSHSRRMLAGTTALYTAKVRRGGMGTGMPYWGNIFTEEELAVLVDRLWTFTMGIAR